MILRTLAGIVGAAFAAAAYAQALPAEPARPEQPAVRKLAIGNRVFTGDFDAMLKRRIIRVAAPYSRTLYYIDKGQERGVSAELVRDFERWVNKKYAKQLGKRPLTVYIGAITRDRLIPEVAEGLYDIAIGNLTVTESRDRMVDFVAPDDVPRVNEIVVTGPVSPAIATLDDLSGQVVHVRPSSSYFESLVAQNERLKAAGKPEAKLVLVPDALEDEDMMEMTNAGLLSIIVVDDWKARMWSRALPKLVVHGDIRLREGGRVGWAVRENSPQLVAELNDFYTSWVRKQGVLAQRMNRATKSRPLRDPGRTAEIKRFDATIGIFEKYGKRYAFDPLMLAAQGFQESTLDQTKRSPVGAIGIMQVMPATGQSLKVGDITLAEPNIHAGAKYMDELMSKYFPNAKFTDQNRTLFAFASYNAGPGNIARMRKEAVKRGLDPDRWFNNVEVVTAEKIGLETTTYVRNIFKYYTSYTLVLAAEDRAAKAREMLSK